MPPQTKKRPGKAKGYQPIDTEGKLFRVRDKDWGDGTEVKIWGENLTYDAAHTLKERVVGAGKSRSARIEEMSVSVPSADPTLEMVRQSGLAAGRTAAAAAQQRAQQLAQRRRQEQGAASAPKARPQPTLVKPVAKKAPEPPTVQLDDTDLEAPEVPDEEELGEGDEIAAAEAGAEDDINEYEQKGKALYDAYAQISPGAKPWAELPPKEQAAFSFEAASEQGPHIEKLRQKANGAAAPSP